MGQQPQQAQQSPIDHRWVTTAFTIDGARIVRSLGIVRGITVRSRSVVGSIGAAFQLMVQHAAALGANGVIGMRYDATEMASGVTEVLCYGTAVVFESAG